MIARIQLVRLFTICEPTAKSALRRDMGVSQSSMTVSASFRITGNVANPTDTAHPVVWRAEHSSRRNQQIENDQSLGRSSLVRFSRCRPRTDSRG